MTTPIPDTYPFGPPSVAGETIPSDGCIIDGSHDSNDGLSERIIAEAHAYGMPRRLNDNVSLLVAIAERYEARGCADGCDDCLWSAATWRERITWASDSAVEWLNDHATGAVFHVEDSCLYVEFLPHPAIDELAAAYWVCHDCYFAHHGNVEHLDENGRTDDGRLPLSEIPLGRDMSDWTDSETGEGHDTFSRMSCDGCRSHLGGDRWRLAVWEPDASAYWAYWRACVVESCDGFTVAMWRVHGRPVGPLGGAQ